MQYSVGVIPGDGIGKEVTAEGLRVLKKIGELENVDFQTIEYEWGCEYYTRSGEMMPSNGLATLKKHDVILMGAVGYPGVPDHISLGGLLLPIRKSFEQYVNLRPARILRGIESPLKGRTEGSFDFVVVRENTEGEYSSIGGKFKEGTADEFVVQDAIFTRKGTERVMRYAFELARKRATKNGKKPHVTAATKSNGIYYSMPFWDSVFREIAKEYPDVSTDIYHIDALSAYLVLKPDYFDVIVASNLFGDILSDLAGAISGGIGLAPSANLNPEGDFPSLFEPVHGSAPDIAGKGVADPIGMLWTISLMLENIGMEKPAHLLLEALQSVTGSGIRTHDVGGTSSTSEVTDSVLEKFTELYSRGRKD